MQFLNPLIWLGALTVTVPILLHLFQRERKTSLSFSSLMFVKRLPVKETRRRRFRYLLLLAMRCLALLLIAAAFARPVVQGSWLDRFNPIGTRSVVIVIDRSMSVSQTSLWDRAKAAARSKIASLAEEDEGKIIQFGEAVEILTEWKSSQPELLATLNTRVTPSFESTAFSEALRTATDELKESRNGTKAIYLISDLQREGMSSEVGWKAPPEVTVEIENLSEPMENLYIQQVRLDREVFSARYPNPILARLTLVPARSTKGEIQLYLEGKLHDRRTFETDDNGSATVTFPPFELEEGLTRGRLTAVFGDALQADNSYYFVLERKAPRKIGLLTDSGAGGRAFFVERALSVGENLPYQLKAVTDGDLGRLDPAEMPLVILADVRNPPPASAARSYLERGGNLIVALGSRVKPQSYDGEWAQLLPARPVEPVFVRGGKHPFISITEISWEHPVFSIFQDVYRNAIGNTRFFSYWKLSANADANVFARFSGGDPALAETAASDAGRIIVLASGLDSTWSDFPLRSAYLPFWQSAVQYATRWNNHPAASRINQVMGLDANEDSAAKATSGGFDVISPSGKRLLALDGERPDSIRFQEPGYYEIRTNKATEWAAANPSAFESNLESVPLEDFLARFVPQRSRSDALREDSEKTIEQERSQSLWWLFLALAALILLLESWLANRTARRLSPEFPMTA